jgi:hypothetical protein
MYAECAVIAALTLAPAAAPGPINPEDGKIAGFTYGEEAYNTYPGWLGSFPWTWNFSQQHIGYPGTAQAGQPFYLHANTALVSPDAVGDVMITIDEDAGMPLRYAPSAEMPLKCYYTQFDTVMNVSETACRGSVTVESGQILVTKLEPISPQASGSACSLPVVTDQGRHRHRRDDRHVGRSAGAPQQLRTSSRPSPSRSHAAPTVTKPLPKKLRKYKTVKSLTPKVCTVKNRKVVVKKSGLCKLKGGKVVVKKRY